MKNKRTRSFLLVVLSSLVLSACATRGQDAPSQYDLGSTEVRKAGFSLPSDMPPVLMAGVQAPYWLDNMMIHYRLAYVDDREIRSYSISRWAMPPARLMDQKLTSRIAAAGGIVLRASDRVRDGILLRMELENFSQRFDSADRSMAEIALRVSAFRGQVLLGQRTFHQYSPAPSPDAAGGVKAMANAGDAIADKVMVWLAELHQKSND